MEPKKEKSVTKLFRVFLLSGSLLLTGSIESTFAQLTTTGIELAPEYDTLVPPPVGVTYVDPTFGSTIKRVSNALSTPNADGGGSLTWIENEYSTMSAFNSDNSKFILVHQSYFALYDGSGFYIHDLPLEINSSSEPRWSRKDNVTLYYHSANMLKSYNISTGAIAVIHTFSEYSSISGNGEMDISFDGDHFVYSGDSRYIFVYQISTGKKFTVLDTAGRSFDSEYITPDNNVIVSWTQSGTVRYTGQELFDINMNFLRQVGHADGHKDVTRDTNGSEVLVWTNSNDPQPIPNCNNGIVKILLASGTQTCLAQLDWSLAVHISAPDGNGTVFVDTEAPANPESGSGAWVPYTNEILQVKLDGSGVIRWAHHRSRPLNSYNWQPKLSVNRDGTRLLYASDFDLQAIDKYTADYSDTYMITIGSAPSTAPPPATQPPPPPPTATTTVVRYQQNSPAVKYTGTWYPNSGGFNSGGSAAMAMDAGSRANFTFTGTGVKWIGYRDAWSGIAQVYLDGSLKATIDTYSASAQAQAAEYTASGLSNAAHVLTIVATGHRDNKSSGPWVWIDAFDVTTVSSTSAPPPPPPPASTPIRIEQNSSSVAYTGGTWFPKTYAWASGGTISMSMDPNARATLSFTGTAVSWIGYRDQWSGIARVYVDGVIQGTIDTYAATAQAQASVYTASGLADGIHTLAIEDTGTHNAVSGGSWVWVDAFIVTP
jgi:hypothetical protein